MEKGWDFTGLIIERFFWSCHPIKIFSLIPLILMFVKFKQPQSLDILAIKLNWQLLCFPFITLSRPCQITVFACMHLECIKFFVSFSGHCPVTCRQSGNLLELKQQQVLLPFNFLCKNCCSLQQWRTVLKNLLLSSCINQLCLLGQEVSIKWKQLNLVDPLQVHVESLELFVA